MPIMEQGLTFAQVQEQRAGLQPKKKRKNPEIPLEPPDPVFASEEEFQAFWDALAAGQGGDAGDPGPATGGQQGATGGQAGAMAAAGQLEALMDVLNNRPTYREVMRRTLDFCRERRTVAQVEEAMQTWPEWPLVMQPPYRIVAFLVQGGGLVQYELDAQGRVITPDRKAGLTPDQADDLVAELVLETTPVGRQAADDLAPLRRLKAMTARFPDRVALYRELLAFCCEPRTYADIEGLITKDKIRGIQTFNFEPGCMMKPSVFVDNMESACGIVWYDHAWHTTDEGKQLLAALQGK